LTLKVKLVVKTNNVDELVLRDSCCQL